MIKVALIGFGYWGPNVARNLYNNKEIHFKYICDLKENRLEKAKSLYAESVIYTKDFQEIIDDKEIDAVCLAVETSNHFTLAKQALEAGKHVYVEKPFTDKLSDAIALKEIANKKNLKIHVDHIMVYHPVIKKIKEIIDSGDFGKILYFDCSRINLGKIKNDVSAMWDLSVHDLSIIDYITDGAIPKKIVAMGEKFYSTKHSVNFLSLQYEDFLANITASWLSPIKERRIIIAGSKKMLVYDDVDVLNKLIVYDKGFDLEKPIAQQLEYADYVVKTRIGDAIIPQLNQEDALGNSIEHFRQCIVEDRESITGAESAIRMITILEKADEQLL
ncbi:MAG: Gfo/Idh/MocA family oxidoreductase [Clostridiaceae bacterium]|nr:Gfo/Idh/MocA family oxidoreductase [Clostridiaceae bacterium]